MFSWQKDYPLLSTGGLAQRKRKATRKGTNEARNKVAGQTAGRRMLACRKKTFRGRPKFFEYRGGGIHEGVRE